jgi:hypothetical protein
MADHDALPVSASLPDIEGRLCAVWAEVLNARAVGPEDNFLDLGGDSIAATLCQNLVWDLFHVEIPMADLLTEHTTLRSLAMQVRHLMQAAPPE